MVFVLLWLRFAKDSIQLTLPKSMVLCYIIPDTYRVCGIDWLVFHRQFPSRSRVIIKNVSKVPVTLIISVLDEKDLDLSTFPGSRTGGSLKSSRSKHSVQRIVKKSNSSLNKKKLFSNKKSVIKKNRNVFICEESELYVEVS